MYDWNRQKLCCNAHFDLRPIPNGGVPKPDWCPIICQLPEGHGRLVDIDEPYLEVMKIGHATINYRSSIAERLGEDSVRNAKVIVHADTKERSES
jgi:hypothetical protein